MADERKPIKEPIADERRWMRLALRLAAKAAGQGETPVGAVIVRQGQIVGRGFNRREQRQDATEHAELMALRQASRRLGRWRLDDCVLYVTLEPCLMCAGALLQARVGGVVFAASDPKAGACGSVTDAFALPWNHRVDVRSGVLADEAAALLRTFFQMRREQNRQEGSRAQRRASRMTGSSGSGDHAQH